MLLNNIKPAFRGILFRKSNSAIIVISFTLGIAAWLLTILWIEAEKKELGSGENRFYMYRVGYLDRESAEFWQDSSGVFHTKLYPETPYLLSDELKNRFKEGITITRFGYFKDKIVSQGDSVRLEKRFAYSDTDFLKFYKFKFLNGDSARFASNINSVIITQSASMYYFGNINSVGKQIIVDNKDVFNIAAVIRDISPYLGIQFEFLAHISLLNDEPDFNNWNINTVNTYVAYPQLQANADIYKAVIEIMNTHIPNFGYKFRLFKPGRINQYSEIRADLSLGSDYQLFSVFSVTSLLVLLIACFNYLIISVGGFTTRAKEIAVRKSFGASRGDIAIQFLFEGLILSIVSLFLAFLLTFTVLNWFGSQTMINIEHGLLFSPRILINCILISVLIGLVAGSYPAFYFSSLSPQQILSSSLRAGMRSSRFSVIISLIQFTVSLMLVFFAFRVEKQLTFLHNSKEGFEPSYTIEIPLTDNLNFKFNDFSKKLKDNSEIIGVSFKHNKVDDISSQPGTGLSKKMNEQYRNIEIILKPKHIAETIEYVGAIWKIFEPDLSFEYNIDDYELNKEFLRDLIIKRVFGFFTIIAGFITILGLFSYSSYNTSIQAGEIAVRKAFGASSFGIYLKLIKQFLSIYSASIILAVILVILFSNVWLNTFIRRIGDFGIEEYIMPCILSFIIIILTISFHSIKASRKPPVTILKKLN